MSYCDDCFKGVTHEGVPEGDVVRMSGVSCYIATPTFDYPKDKVVIYLTDVFGLALKNNCLLADDFARNGFKTVVIDLFNGDPVPESAFAPGAPPFEREKWFAAHGQAQTRPPIDRVVGILKDEGATRFAATGYCFGARYVFDLAFDGVIQVSAITHPGGLKIPEHLENYLAVSKAPLLINSCTVDRPFPPEAQAKADELFGGGKFAPGYRREYFEGCKHGFAVRGDISDPKVKAGKEGAFKACVEWFKEYL
ncbi:dienelactone hydrolase endo-1,3,1,4-beta-D-glucanase [Favolaschia claudopus]|uniref:Dienelactone hydrolase endo-1,3,1,4-beta-D-glucanase n=1 Tax=Favolaschia claudopus TaxID=2862362 RepID=A0AAW0D0S2_9AGAR